MNTKLGAWEQPGRRLPTLDGCVEGIVGWQDLPNGCPVATLQCVVCHITYTDVAVIAVQKINHMNGLRRAVPYKRCPDCHFADLHPNDEDAARLPVACGWPAARYSTPRAGPTSPTGS